MRELSAATHGVVDPPTIARDLPDQLPATSHQLRFIVPPCTSTRPPSTASWSADERPVGCAQRCRRSAAHRAGLPRPATSYQPPATIYSPPMHFDTTAIHSGNKRDEATGSIAPPIHLSTTFQRTADGELPHGFSYIRDG